MQINIHTQHISLNEPQEMAIRNKIEKLTHLASRISDESSEIKADIVYEESKKPEDAYICTLTFFVPQDVLRAEARAESLDNAVDEVTEKIKAQIEKYKAKTHHEV